MLEYHLLFHSLTSPGLVAESISAADDDEARSVAELRLLMTSGVASISVLKDGITIIALERDARYRRAHSSGLEAFGSGCMPDEDVSA